MLTISDKAYAAFAADGRSSFARELADFIESEFPEDVTPDGAHVRALSEHLLARCDALQIDSRESILRYSAVMLGYHRYDPEGFAWIDEQMADETLDAEHRLLLVEHRLFGRPVWQL